MATEVKVPTTGNAGEDAVIMEWQYAVGDTVSAGAVLVSLETAKAVVDVECPVSGTLLAKNGEEGHEIGEHEVIAVVGAPGESLPTTDTVDEQLTPEPTSEVLDAAPTTDRTNGIASDSHRMRVSPRARKLAVERGVDLTSLEGSGPLGRIVIADIPQVGDSQGAVEPSPVSPIAAPAAESRAPRTVPVRGARKVTAERMHASTQATASVTITRYASASALESYSRRLREVTDRRDTQRIGINELVLFAVAQTVGGHPSANAWFSSEEMKQFEAVHLGFAVDTKEALLVPVIRDADLLGLSDLTEHARSMIHKSREGKLSPAEMTGGTFTVSNLGGLGVHWFTPILNPPQVCILGVGAIQPGNDMTGSQLPLSLTFDHRAIDGVTAATLLAEITDAIEHIDTLAAF